MSVMDFRDDLGNLHSQNSPQDPTDHSYRHNIFDVSAPAASSPHSSLGFNDFHDQHNVHQNMQQHHHAYLNSTLPALNSSMRYDPLPPPDTFGFSAGAGLNRHTPSPIDGHNARESRSRSRPPTGQSTGVVRTTRTRRTGSMSSTSPPPPNGTSQWGIDFAMQRPGAQAIVIPRSHSQSGHHNGTPVSPVSAGWDYSLPPPDNLAHSLPSLHHHQHHPHHGSYGNGYPSNNFGLGISPGTESLGLSASLTSSNLSGSPTSNGPPTPPSATTGPPPTGKGEKTTLLASEKRRRRRESHNAVERRRRDNINEKIGELATLIPISMLAADGEKVPNGGTNGLITIPITSTNSRDIEAIAGLTPPEGSEASELWNVAKESSPSSEARDGSVPPSLQEGGVVKANKGMILRKSVEYIRYLQQIVTAQGARNRELEDQVRAYREGPHSAHGTKTPTPGSLGAFSAYGVSGSITGIGMGMFGASLEDLPEHLEENEDNDDDPPYRGRSTTKRGGATSKRVVHNVDMDGTDDEEMELVENARGEVNLGLGKEVKMEL